MSQGPAKTTREPFVPATKVPEEKRCEIRAHRIRTNDSFRKMELLFGIPKSTIELICNEDPVETLKKHTPKLKEAESSPPK